MQGFDAKDIDDLVVEGAICLMEKIGLAIEDKVKKSNKDEQKTQLSNIMKRFEELNSDKCKEISNRVKLLIKNMFANQKSGWQKTKDLNDAGPKTKKEIQDEMAAKQQKMQ